ncbi:MAG: phosphate/phosphite/phosphonate ABC transporter substrate-binding protein [Azoarcus sp.]|jgi:phosphonate transport system substrate-binding protein|nr:phosphate/phosphite/phosphonate ABC transporter substrate-binding protein [Azoarcus sp.]
MRQAGYSFIFFFAVLCGGIFPWQFARNVAAAEAVHAVEAPGKILRLGIAPFYSAPALSRTHRPLRDYLSRVLGAEIVVYSARDHERFLHNALDGGYDIVISPGHFLPMLAKAGFMPLVRYRTPLELLLVVRDDSGIERLDDLRGRRIGLPDRLSFYHILGMQWLSTLDLHPQTDYVLSEWSSHMALLLAVCAGQADVAVTGRSPVLMLDANVRKRLKVLDAGHPTFPSLVTLARGDLGGAGVERIRAALGAFPESPEGERFFADSGYGGYVPATMQDVRQARRYESQVHRLLISTGNTAGTPDEQ